MKTAAVICEFNPFHKGHAYLFGMARQFGADFVICLMSGDYVQRGEPAILDRYVRAEMALDGGADVVLSYPARYAASSAESFASHAVRILDKLGCVDELIFGSESGDAARIMECARHLAFESRDYQTKLKTALREGLSFPRARENALPEFRDLLGSPNDILAIEYCKALIRCDSRIRPVTVKRIGAGHHEAGFRKTPDGNHAENETAISASAGTVRSAMRLGEAEYLSAIPVFCHAALKRYLSVNCLMGADAYDALLLDALWRAGSADELAVYCDVTPEIAGTFLRERVFYTDRDEFIRRCTSKTVPASHIARALLSLTLGLKDDPPVPSAAVTQLLGFRKEASGLLSRMNKECLVINPVKDIPKLSGPERFIIEEDFRVSNLYEALLAQRSGRRAVPALARPVIKR